MRRPWRVTDRKSTRLNSSHANISYAVFCLKKKEKKTPYKVLNTATDMYCTQLTPRAVLRLRVASRVGRSLHLRLRRYVLCFFFLLFNDTATTEIYPLSLHDALPISASRALPHGRPGCSGSACCRTAPTAS